MRMPRLSAAATSASRCRSDCVPAQRTTKSFGPLLHLDEDAKHRPLRAPRREAEFAEDAVDFVAVEIHRQVVGPVAGALLIAMRLARELVVIAEMADQLLAFDLYAASRLSPASAGWPETLISTSSRHAPNPIRRFGSPCLGDDGSARYRSSAAAAIAPLQHSNVAASSALTAQRARLPVRAGVVSS